MPVSVCTRACERVGALTGPERPGKRSFPEHNGRFHSLPTTGKRTPLHGSFHRSELPHLHAHGLGHGIVGTRAAAAAVDCLVQPSVCRRLELCACGDTDGNATRSVGHATRNTQHATRNTQPARTAERLPATGSQRRSTPATVALQRRLCCDVACCTYVGCCAPRPGLRSGSRCHGRMPARTCAAEPGSAALYASLCASAPWRARPARACVLMCVRAHGIKRLVCRHLGRRISRAFPPPVALLAAAAVVAVAAAAAASEERRRSHRSRQACAPYWHQYVRRLHAHAHARCTCPKRPLA